MTKRPKRAKIPHATCRRPFRPGPLCWQTRSRVRLRRSVQNLRRARGASTPATHRSKCHIRRRAHRRVVASLRLRLARVRRDTRTRARVCRGVRGPRRWRSTSELRPRLRGALPQATRSRRKYHRRAFRTSFQSDGGLQKRVFPFLDRVHGPYAGGYERGVRHEVRREVVIYRHRLFLQTPGDEAREALSSVVANEEARAGVGDQRFDGRVFAAALFMKARITVRPRRKRCRNPPNSLPLGLLVSRNEVFVPHRVVECEQHRAAVVHGRDWKHVVERNPDVGVGIEGVPHRRQHRAAVELVDANRRRRGIGTLSTESKPRGRNAVEESTVRRRLRRPLSPQRRQRRRQRRKRPRREKIETRLHVDAPLPYWVLLQRYVAVFSLGAIYACCASMSNAVAMAPRVRCASMTSSM